jgi:hypothetical protein
MSVNNYFQSLSRQFDITREEIVGRFRERIARSQRTKLEGQELEELIDIFITRLTSLVEEESIKQICQCEIALFEEGYPVATVAKNHLPKYRKAILIAISDKRIPLTENNSHIYTYFKDGAERSTREHLALTYLKYDFDTYEQIARSTTRNNNLKQDSLQPVNLALYLETVRSLLSSSQPLESAIAIAAVTGRRYSEVMARGKFTATEHPYQLYFKGQLKKRIAHAPCEGAGGRSKQHAPDAGVSPACRGSKKRDSVDDEYLIYTLVPADLVLEAIERLRTYRELAELEKASIEQINRLNTPINRLIKYYFQDTDLVPILKGEAGVTIQNLRGIYGEIAVHFFCPQNIGVHRFIQQKLGHLINDTDLASSKNSASTEHYFHYYLIDSDRQLLTERGILLSRDSNSRDAARVPASSVENSLEMTDLGETLEWIIAGETEGSSDTKTVTEDSIIDYSPTSSMNTILTHTQDRSSYLKAIETLIRHDDYRYILVGLMAASGLNATSLLKLLVFKQAAATNLILYCQQLHPSYLPLQQLLVLVDSQLFMNTIGNLRRNRDAINFSYPLSVEEIDRAVANLIPDILDSVGLPKGLDLLQQYQDFLPSLFGNLHDGAKDVSVSDGLIPLRVLVEEVNTQQASISSLTRAIEKLITLAAPSRHYPAGEIVRLQNSSSLLLSDNNSSRQLISSLPDRQVQTQGDPHSSSIDRKEKGNQKKFTLPSKHSRLREKIDRYVDAVMAYNNTPNRPHEDKWMISITLLKELAGCGQSAVYVVYNARKDEIEAHNRLHQLGSYHNRKSSKDSPSASEVIRIDSDLFV